MFQDFSFSLSLYLQAQRFVREAHLNELVQGGVGGIVGNEEPHVFVCDLHRGRSIHTSHGDNAKTKSKSLPWIKNVNGEQNSEGMSNKNVQRAPRNFFGPPSRFEGKEGGNLRATG